MGAINFIFTALGTNPCQVYDEACEKAIREYGEDSYNGTISTTNSLVRAKEFYHMKDGKKILKNGNYIPLLKKDSDGKVTINQRSLLPKKNCYDKKASVETIINNFIFDYILADCSNRTAYYLDLGVYGYRVTTVKVVPVKKENNIETKYAIFKRVYDSDRILHYKPLIQVYKDKTEAKNALLKFVKKDYNSYYIRKIKYNAKTKYEANDILFDTEITVKEYNKKPKKIPPNSKIEEIHKYVLFGWAAS